MQPDTLRWRYVASWKIARHPGRLLAVPAIEVRTSKIYLLMKIYRRLTLGKEENLCAYYAVVTERLGEPAWVN
jgi:hypothetical protein